MSEPVVIALITALGALLTAVLVEIVRRERAQRRTDDTLRGLAGQMSPNGGASMHDAVTEIRRDVREIKRQQGQQGERLRAVEVRLSDHLNAPRS
ncbi:hypothetical protein B0I33_104509 [Prauserella shujinwangii]|uniref:Uncharacterized protein n=1 Tax=Prauserella shujinwangii TaxID=1453103 RepID=A0A2T0LXD3_9PSEU|nr:hypothetical protein [Prauserella shujinwangii]PRX48691.1 hypothetical protein B0I33_104509 [Prauserella shujinwangii]